MTVHCNALYTDAQRELAVSMVRRNAPVEDIIERIGCSRRTIQLWAREAGVARSSRSWNRRHSDEVRADVLRKYVEEGRSSHWISDVYDGVVARATVLKWVRAAGHKVRKDYRHRLLDEQHIEDLHAQGMSARKIPATVGCSVSGVYSALRRAVRQRIRAEIREAAE